MTKESAVEIEHLYTTITQIYRSLETLGRPVHTWDDIFVFTGVQRLDSESVKAWEHHLGSSRDPPTSKKFLIFLMTRLLTLQAVEKSRRPGLQSHQQSFKAHLTYEGQATNTSTKCSICSSNHDASNCPDYANKSVEHRIKITKRNNLCFNCLGQHRALACRSIKRCTKCGKKHHSAIHAVRKSDQPISMNSDSGAQTNCAAFQQTSSSTQTLLATVQLIVISDTDEQTKVRAFIDPRSQISLVSERLGQHLNLLRYPKSLQVKRIGAVKAGRTSGLVSVKLRPYFESQAECIITAHLLPKLTCDFPAITRDNHNWSHLAGLQLADPDFQSSGQIDVIIGADYYGQIIEEGLRRGPANSPIGQATIFGWIIIGPAKTCSSFPEVQGYHVSIGRELSEILQRFWTLDEIPNARGNSLSTKDQECEDYFKTTHVRDNTGRYIVRIPCQKSTDNPGDSKLAALRILSRLSRKLQADPDLHEAYSGSLSEYENLNHMKQVQTGSPKPSRVF